MYINICIYIYICKYVHHVHINTHIYIYMYIYCFCFIHTQDFTFSSNNPSILPLKGTQTGQEQSTHRIRKHPFWNHACSNTVPRLYIRCCIHSYIKSCTQAYIRSCIFACTKYCITRGVIWAKSFPYFTLFLNLLNVQG